MKILSRPKGNAEEYGRWAVNAYLGCQNRCKYCYLQSGPGAKNLGGSVAKLKAHVINEEHAYHLAMAEIIENREAIIRDGGLFFTFTSDPCIKDTRNLNFTIAHDALMMRIPVTMLTKDATFLNLDPFDEEIIGLDKEEDWRRSIPFYHSGSGHLSFIDNPHFTTDTTIIAFGFTLTGHNELEPNASSNEERINAMQRLNERSFKTWASIEPVIDFPSSLDMIRKALDAGCRHFKIGLLTKNTKVCRKEYDAAECLAFVQDVMQLTRDRATVYWKQSFRDFIGGTPAHRLFTDDELHKIFDDYPNAVTKDWTMFNI